MKRELWFSGSAVAAGVFLGLALLAAALELVDQDGRGRVAERQQRGRVVKVAK